MKKDSRYEPLRGLKAAIVIRNLSTNDFAEEMGVTNQTIYNWINGDASPDMDQIRKAAKVLKVTTDFILFPEMQLEGLPI